jgi:hypothetical protein
MPITALRKGVVSGNDWFVYIARLFSRGGVNADGGSFELGGEPNVATGDVGTRARYRRARF